MNLTNLMLAALGGALGSAARALISGLFPAEAGRLPWATIFINVAGSLAIGWFMGRIGAPSGDTARWHSLFVTGVCGGFTTFSAFSWQTLALLQKN